MDSTAWIIVSLIALFLLGQFAFLYRSKGMQGRIAPDMTDLLSDAQKAQPRLIFYFHSPRCGMCKQVWPILKPLMDERFDIIEVDVSKRPDVARRFKVMGTPTLMRVQEGRIEKVMMGAKDEKTIRDFVEAQ